MPADPTRGLLDTNIVILRHGIAPDEPLHEMAISAITLAERSAGVHLVSGDNAGAIRERARRADVVQRAENAFNVAPTTDSLCRCVMPTGSKISA
jgi:hypothetical protein